MTAKRYRPWPPLLASVVFYFLVAFVIRNTVFQHSPVYWIAVLAIGGELLCAAYAIAGNALFAPTPLNIISNRRSTIAAACAGIFWFVIGWSIASVLDEVNTHARVLFPIVSIGGTFVTGLYWMYGFFEEETRKG